MAIAALVAVRWNGIDFLGLWASVEAVLPLGREQAYPLSGDDAADYTVVIDSMRRFVRRLLSHVLPQDVGLFNINVPAGAAPGTGWRLPHLSRRRYFLPPPRRWPPKSARGGANGRAGGREILGGTEGGYGLGWMRCIDGSGH